MKTGKEEGKGEKAGTAGGAVASDLQPARRVSADQKDAEIELASDLEVIVDQLHGDKILLRDTSSRSLYLTKVGVVFMVYFGGIAAVCLLLLFSEETARYYYRLWALQNFDTLIVIMVLVIKLSFGLAGSRLRNLSLVFFLLDLVLSLLALLGIYFWFEWFLKTQYIWSGHYVVIFGINLFATSIGFTFSTLRADEVRSYNYTFGVLLMAAANFVTCAVFYAFLDVVTMKRTRYVYIFLFFLLVDIYFAVNAYLVVNYRITKFYDHEHIYCYFCFWVDWFTNLWTDSFGSRRDEVRQALERKRLQKLERERAVKEAQRAVQAADIAKAERPSTTRPVVVPPNRA